MHDLKFTNQIVLKLVFDIYCNYKTPIVSLRADCLVLEMTKPLTVSHFHSGWVENIYKLLLFTVHVILFVVCAADRAQRWPRAQPAGGRVQHEDAGQRCRCRCAAVDDFQRQRPPGCQAEVRRAGSSGRLRRGARTC